MSPSFRKMSLRKCRPGEWARIPAVATSDGRKRGPLALPPGPPRRVLPQRVRKPPRCLGVAGSSSVFPAPRPAQGWGCAHLGGPTLAPLPVCHNSCSNSCFRWMDGLCRRRVGHCSGGRAGHSHDPGPLEGAQTPLIFPKDGESGSLLAPRAASLLTGQALGPPCS